MLNNLKVVNGSITPEFNSEIFEYDVEVEDTVISLVLDYEVDKDATVTVYGNNFLTKGENHVLIEVFKDKLYTYTLVVNKEETKEIIGEVSNGEKIEVSLKNDILSDLLLPGIIGICFLTIVALFCVIFRKKQ